MLCKAYGYFVLDEFEFYSERSLPLSYIIYTVYMYTVYIMYYYVG